MKRSSDAKDAVVIGGSAGGLEALNRILPYLPGDYRLAVIIVLHQHRHGGKHLRAMLAERCKLPVLPVEDKERILAGRVYVCPPNYHVLVETGETFNLSTDAAVNFARPSIDVLFESAARVYGDRMVGVLLSGASADGALGLSAIVRSGGLAACQEPTTAVESRMPRAGCAAATGAFVGSPDELGKKLAGVDS
jgi:two-component system, chemotaxis family, protein-glutamate methylesterase/glutaminase